MHGRSQFKLLVRTSSWRLTRRTTGLTIETVISKRYQPRITCGREAMEKEKIAFLFVSLFVTVQYHLLRCYRRAAVTTTGTITCKIHKFYSLSNASYCVVPLLLFTLFDHNFECCPISLTVEVLLTWT